MKLAILIVGEYRSFSKCRKTMLFLDQDLDKDIYLSTWNITNIINPISFNNPKFKTYEPVYREVTKEEIMKDIGLPATIALHTPIRNSIPSIINGWILGFDLIKKSNIYYDYVLMFRPDTFFNNNSQGQFWMNSKLEVDRFNDYRSSIGVRPPGRDNALCDQLYFSSYENIEMILSDKFIPYFRDHITQLSWHQILYNYIVKHLKLTINSPPFTSVQYCIAREPMSDADTYNTVDDRWWQWFRENNN
jgi:hypothetical protein